MERERNYSCKFKWSYEEIDKREIVRLKSGLDDAIRVDEIVSQNGHLDIHPVNVITFSIHNEKVKQGDNTDYDKYLIYDGDNFYSTSSTPLVESMMDIMDDMSDFDDNYTVRVYKKQGKNINGFLTCKLM